MLENITPLILTYNEGPNIGRTLERLAWANDIVVVDSFSDDDTLKILSSYSQVRVYQRTFDNFAAQWNFAVKQTKISTEWVLALDADFIITPKLLCELEALTPVEDIDGYLVRLVYCIQGRPLRSSLLPRLPVLLRRRRVTFLPDAHTHKVELKGKMGALTAPIHHDDRKSLSRWFATQDQHASLEAAKILGSRWSQLNSADRIRRLRVIAPTAVFVYCLMKGLPLDGWAGVYYSFQRAVAELLLSIHLLESDLTVGRNDPSQSADSAPRTEFQHEQVAKAAHPTTGA